MSTAITLFLALLAILVITFLLALTIRHLVQPLPYHDPEPPTSRHD